MGEQATLSICNSSAVFLQISTWGLGRMSVVSATSPMLVTPSLHPAAKRMRSVVCQGPSVAEPHSAASLGAFRFKFSGRALLDLSSIWTENVTAGNVGFFYCCVFSYIFFFKWKQWEDFKEQGTVQVFWVWHRKRQDSMSYSVNFFSPAVQFQQFSAENSCGALGFIIMRMNFWPIFIRIEIRMLSHRRIFLEKSLAGWEREDYRMCAHLKKKKRGVCVCFLIV